MIKWSLLIQRM